MRQQVFGTPVVDLRTPEFSYGSFFLGSRIFGRYKFLLMSILWVRLF